MTLSKHEKKMQNIMGLLFLLMPILNQYQFIFLTCWELFALIATLYGLVDKKWKIAKPISMDYFLFCVYILISSLVIGLTYKDFSLYSMILRFVKFAVVSIFMLSILPKYIIDFRVIRKWYTRILVVISLVLLLQLIIYYMLGQQFYPMIPNVTLNYNDGINSSNYIRSTISQIAGGYYFRPSSFFIEPAHYALFSLPGIIIELFDPIFSKKNVFFAIMFTVCALLTTSSLALVACAVCWLLFVVSRRDLWKTYFGWMASIVVCLIPIALYFVMSNSSIMTTINIKLAALSNINQSSSISLRLVRGIQYFSNMDLVHQLFGTGYGNLTSYFYENNMSIVGSGIIGQVSYMNGISTILCSFGIIGFLLFLIFIVRKYLHSDIVGKTLIVVFMLVMLGSDMFDSVYYYVFVLLIFMKKYRVGEKDHEYRY